MEEGVADGETVGEGMPWIRRKIKQRSRERAMGFEYSEQKKTEKQNNTGIPDNMKKRFEEFSAVSFDDVRVHYNSEKPARLNALAYTKGTQVYIAPGQDKHLPHELGHVVQQKQGRVKPTGKINGMSVNEDAALEREADNFLSAGYSHNNINNITGKGIGAMEAPVQMVRGEADSVFDFEKLKEFIKELMDRNILGRKAWVGEELDEEGLDSYTERVQTILEDIRQVDLQFLAITKASFEEEGLLEDEASFKDKLTKGEKTNFGDRAALQNKYKNIIIQKCDYLKSIKEKLEAQCNEAHRKYLIAVANHGRARKPKTVRRLKKVMDRLKHEDEQLYAHRKYLADVKKQIKILETILENGAKKGYVFNLNALLMETDDKIRFYMAIVAPSKTREHKDISKDEEGRLTGYSDQLQFGIGTPIRSFSWYLKYLIDTAAAVNNTPLIRAVDMPSFYLQEWHRNAVSEAFKGDDNDNPMNEDHKVPNQFGTPVLSRALEHLLMKNLGLTTIGEREAIPEKLISGGGDFEEFSSFKMDIGFERVRDGVRTPTDVHFFDSKHTAFFSIDNKNDKVTALLYSPKEANAALDEYSKLMYSLLAITGSAEYMKTKAGRQALTAGTLSKNEIMEKITEMLEANHCLPQNRKYDLHGNIQEALDAEKGFASDYIAMSDFNKNGRVLVNLTKGRYELWHGSIKKEFDDKIRGIKEKIREINDKINGIKGKTSKKERMLTYKDSLQNNIALVKEEARKKIYLLTLNSGILYELQEIEKINGKGIFTRLPSLNIEAFFDEMEVVFKTGQEGKLHVIALCFKILRIIKDNQVERGDYQEMAGQYDDLEQELFETRTVEASFAGLNRHGGKEIMIGGENVFIPYDKMTSTGRFKPQSGKPKYESIPFTGGVSGTTRDISKDLLSKEMLKDEDEYWKFQMLNASFMILYSYHSFIEVIYRAATTRMEYCGEEKISRYILKYLKDLNDMGCMPDSESILADINEIIRKKRKKNISNYKRNKPLDMRRGRKQSRQNKRNRLLREAADSDLY